MPFKDFQAQFFQGVIIEVVTVTIPYALLTAVYCSQRGGISFVALVGVTVHLANLLIGSKHIFSAQIDEERACRFLDPRTCFKLREKCKCTCACLKVVEEDTA